MFLLGGMALGVCFSTTSVSYAASATDATTPAASTAKGVHFAPPFPGCAETISWSLQNYYRANSKRQHTPAMADQSKLESLPPIAFYLLNSEDMLAGKGLAASKLNYFMSYIKSGGKLAAEIHIDVNEEGTLAVGGSNALVEDFIYNLKQDNEAKFVAEVEQTKVLEQLRQGSYEIRILDLPPYKRTRWPPPNDGLRGEVIWLKSDTGDGDFIFTTSSDKQEPGLKPNTLYTVDAMIKAIEPAVKAYLDSPPLPPIDPYGAPWTSY